jgi:urease accessory protein
VTTGIGTRVTAPPRRARLGLAALILPVLLVSMDMSVLYPAMPTPTAQRAGGRPLSTIRRGHRGRECLGSTRARPGRAPMSMAMLLTLADSRLPIGGHVHSGGVEEAVVSGLVHDAGSVELYLRRRICTSGLVAASLAAAVCAGALDPARAEAEADARTPAPAARAASRAQGRGLLRLARRVWPDHEWAVLGPRPHLSTVFGVVGAVAGMTPEQIAGVVVYTTMTGAATAAQRLLALDPATVAACTVRLAPVCDRAAAEAVEGLAARSDPLQDGLAQRHAARDMPLFAS